MPKPNNGMSNLLNIGAHGIREGIKLLLNLDHAMLYDEKDRYEDEVERLGLKL